MRMILLQLRQKPLDLKKKKKKKKKKAGIFRQKLEVDIFFSNIFSYGI